MMNRRDALTTMSIAGGASLIPSADAIAGSLTAGASEAFQQALRGTGPVKIRDIKTILTAPNRIRLVVVKVETTEPGLVGWGCATFTQRSLVVQTAVNDFLRPFLIGRNVDEIEDTWYFFPAASAFIDGNWALTFTPNADGSGEGLLTISLQAEDNYISYSTTDLSLATTTDICEVEVDHKGSDGAAGSFSCTDAVGFRPSGATVDGVTITDSGVGATGPRLKLTDCDITDNSGTGVSATQRGVKLTRTHVLRNGGDGDLAYHGKDNRAVDRHGEKLPMFGRYGETRARIIERDKPMMATTGMTILPSLDVETSVLATAGARPWDRDGDDIRVLFFVAEGRGEIIDDETEVSAYPVFKPVRAPFVEADWDMETLLPRKGWPEKRRPK